MQQDHQDHLVSSTSHNTPATYHPRQQQNQRERDMMESNENTSKQKKQPEEKEDNRQRRSNSTLPQSQSMISHNSKAKLLIPIALGICFISLCFYFNEKNNSVQSEWNAISNARDEVGLKKAAVADNLHEDNGFWGSSEARLLEQHVEERELALKTTNQDLPNLKLSDLVAWQGFYSSMSGNTWYSCNSTIVYENPCYSECAGKNIFCEIVKGEFRITKLVLQDMNLHGWLLESHFQTLSALKYIDISGSKNSFDNIKCVNVPQCYTYQAYCNAANTKASFCPPLPLKPSDLVAWQALYSSLQGRNWKFCNDYGAYQNPCGSSCNLDPDRRITCEPVGSTTELRITEMRLQNNNLNGWLSESTISALTALNYIDFRGPDNRFGNVKCVTIPRCYLYEAACLFENSGLQLCPAPPTLRPTLSPSLTPTGSPSNSPTKTPTSTPSVLPSSSPTKSPTTLAPSIAPTTKTPTSDPTASPTTKNPSKDPTRTPTVSPSNSPTKAPTTSAPSKAPTKVPTASPTKSPVTEVPTKAPSSLSPSKAPSTSQPTKSPSKSPSKSPIKLPTKSPSKAPITSSPTKAPSATPTTGEPTKSPSKAPFKAPTLTPTRSPSAVPTIAPTIPMNKNDLLAWQAFYLGVRGSNWDACGSEKMYEDPCNIAPEECFKAEYRVVCKPENRELRIAIIILPNNNLRGWLPDDAINSMTSLRFFDVSNSIASSGRANVFGNTKCLNIPGCYGNIDCNFQFTSVNLCPKTASPTYAPIAPSSLSPTNRPIANPTQAPSTSSPVTSNQPTSSPSTLKPTVMTASPTSGPTFPLLVDDLTAWQAIYDALSAGDNWVECGNITVRDNPCDIRIQGDCSFTRKVTCTQIGQSQRITEIKLPDNNLYGWLPESALRSLDALTLIDVRSTFNSSTPNSLLNTQCISADFCYRPNRACLFEGSGASVCPLPTRNPTKAPTPPTRSPTTAVPTAPTRPTVKPTLPAPTAAPVIPYLYSDDLVAWQSFYDQMNGLNWIDCKDSRKDPCRSCNLSTDLVVKCVLLNATLTDSSGNPYNTKYFLRLSEIRMTNNNVRGVLPEDALETLDYLRYFDISNIPGTTYTDVGANVVQNPIPADPCLYLEFCYKKGITCDISRTSSSICSNGTLRPTRNPSTATPSPTGRTIIPTSLPNVIPTTSQSPTLPRTRPPNSSRSPSASPSQTSYASPTSYTAHPAVFPSGNFNSTETPTIYFNTTSPINATQTPTP